MRESIERTAVAIEDSFRCSRHRADENLTGQGAPFPTILASAEPRSASSSRRPLPEAGDLIFTRTGEAREQMSATAAGVADESPRAAERSVSSSHDGKRDHRRDHGARRRAA